MSLVERIQNLMNTDDENPEKQSIILEAYYRDASKDEKHAVDMCFIALCGYSIKSLLADETLGK